MLFSRFTIIRLYCIGLIGFVSGQPIAIGQTLDVDFDEPADDRYVYISYGEEGLPDSEVFEISVAQKRAHRRIEDRLSLTVLKTDRTNYGFDAGSRYYIGRALSLYVGYGLFVGEYNECETVDGEEECETIDTAAIYPEFGYMVSLGKARVVFFNRYYYQFTAEHPRNNMIGFSVGYQF